MARTVIDLDDKLYAEASRLLGTTTKVATVNEALRRIVEMQLVEESKRTAAIERMFASDLAARAHEEQGRAWQ